MIKCLFVDIASISTDTPKSKFNKSQIEALADSILINDGLLRPLLLQQVAGDRYTVIAGHLEYYAAVRAKEKNLHKAEMVNAFIIPPTSQQLAIAQLKLLSTDRATDVDRQVDVQAKTTNLELENSDRLAAVIQFQLQPLQQQLTNVIAELAAHTQILKSLSPQPIQVKKDDSLPESIANAIEPTVDDKTEPKPINEKVTTAPQPPQKTKAEKSPSVNAKKTQSAKAEPTPALLPEKELTSQAASTPKKPSAKSSENYKAERSKAPAPKSASTTKSITKPQAEQSKDISPQPADTPKKPSARSTAAKPKADPFAALDPERLVTTLNLINELSLNELTLRMSRSRIVTAANNAAKIAAGIVAERDARVDRQFATWADLLAAKIDGLTATSATKIIKKLK